MTRVFIVLTLATLAAPSIADETRLPDIVVYMADDLSARDLSLYGGTNINTPAVNALADGGMTFDQAFVASAAGQSESQPALKRLCD